MSLNFGKKSNFMPPLTVPKSCFRPLSGGATTLHWAKKPYQELTPVKENWPSWSKIEVQVKHKVFNEQRRHLARPPFFPRPSKAFLPSTDKKCNLMQQYVPTSSLHIFRCRFWAHRNCHFWRKCPKKCHFGQPNKNFDTTFISPASPKNDGIAFGFKQLPLLGGF